MKRKSFTEDTTEVESSYEIKRYSLRSLLKEISNYFLIDDRISFEFTKRARALDAVEISLKRFSEVLCLCVASAPDSVRMTYSANQKKATLKLDTILSQDEMDELVSRASGSGFGIEFSEDSVIISLKIKTGVSVVFYAKTQRIIYNTLKNEFLSIKKQQVLP